jgi:hypothetical protein
MTTPASGEEIEFYASVMAELERDEKWKSFTHFYSNDRRLKDIVDWYRLGVSTAVAISIEKKHWTSFATVFEDGKKAGMMLSSTPADEQSEITVPDADDGMTPADEQSEMTVPDADDGMTPADEQSEMTVPDADDGMTTEQRKVLARFWANRVKKATTAFLNISIKKRAHKTPVAKHKDLCEAVVGNLEFKTNLDGMREQGFFKMVSAIPKALIEGGLLPETEQLLKAMSKEGSSGEALPIRVSMNQVFYQIVPGNSVKMLGENKRRYKLINGILGEWITRIFPKQEYSKLLVMQNKTGMNWKEAAMHCDHTPEMIDEMLKMEDEKRACFILIPLETAVRLYIGPRFRRGPGAWKKRQSVAVNVGDILMVNFDCYHASGTPFSPEELRKKKKKDTKKAYQEKDDEEDIPFIGLGSRNPDIVNRIRSGTILSQHRCLRLHLSTAAVQSHLSPDFVTHLVSDGQKNLFKTARQKWPIADDITEKRRKNSLIKPKMKTVRL